MTEQRPADRPAFTFAAGSCDGFRLTWLDDGFDYPALWRSFRAGEQAGRLLHSLPSGDDTWKLESGGRSFILQSGRPDLKASFLKRLLAGPLFGRRFRLAWRALARGCDLIPRLYLLAEKPHGFGRSAESFLLIEYLEGETLASSEPPVPEDWLRGLEECLAGLHRCGLASGNAHPGNLVRTAAGWKMIDLSFKFPMLISQANDVIDSGRKFGAVVPVASPALKAAVGLMRLKRAWIKRGKKRRKRAGR